MIRMFAHINDLFKKPFKGSKWVMFVWKEITIWHAEQLESERSRKVRSSWKRGGRDSWKSGTVQALDTLWGAEHDLTTVSWRSKGKLGKWRRLGIVELTMSHLGLMKECSENPLYPQMFWESLCIGLLQRFGLSSSFHEVLAEASAFSFESNTNFRCRYLKSGLSFSFSTEAFSSGQYLIIPGNWGPKSSNWAFVFSEFSVAFLATDGSSMAI